MRPKDQDAMAVLFDAMMFLTVMTLVSISLMTVLGIDRDSDEEAQEYVEQVHGIIMSSTVADQEGPPCTVADLVESYLRSGEEYLAVKIEALVGPVLARYFGPGTGYEWAMESDDVRSSFGASAPGPPGGRDVHVSQVAWSDGPSSFICRLKVTTA